MAARDYLPAQRWQKKHGARRFDLIRRQNRGETTPAEDQELAVLEAELDALIPPMDIHPELRDLFDRVLGQHP